MSKCKVIAVANQKGGVGKTTTTANVAIGLARNGQEVLIVDFDPQGDLTASLGWKNNDALENTVSTMLDDYINDKEIHYPSLILTHSEDVDVIPANIELADFEMRLVSVINREQVLHSCLEPLWERYDYILIDCPPFFRHAHCKCSICSRSGTDPCTGTIPASKRHDQAVTDNQ